VATTREFARTLGRELDFSYERRNMEQFTRNFAEDPTIHVPTIYPDQCARRVLTMEMLRGIPGSKPEKITASGVDLNEFASRAANVFLNMIFASVLLRAYMELLPGFSETVFGHDPKEGVAILVSAAGLGAIVASLLIGNLTQMKTLLRAYFISVVGSLFF